MQVSRQEFDPKKHKAFRTLCVKQPFAQAIADGEVTIEIRSENTSYRGNVLLCSKRTPTFPHITSGAMLALVEIYDTKPVRLFTRKDWKRTRIPKEKRKEIKGGYGWYMRNQRKLVELPIRCERDLDIVYFTEEDITCYPTAIKINEQDRTLLRATYE